MADLSVRCYASGGRSPIGAIVSLLATGAEAITLSDTVSRALGLAVSLSDSLRVVANTASITWVGSGFVAFYASPDHATVTGYTARLRVSGNATVVATQALGTPTPDGNNVIIADLTSLYSGRAAGDYTVSILATDAGGSTDSAESNAFTLPLS